MATPRLCLCLMSEVEMVRNTRSLVGNVRKGTNASIQIVPALGGKETEGKKKEGKKGRPRSRN